MNNFYCQEKFLCEDLEIEQLKQENNILRFKVEYQILGIGEQIRKRFKQKKQVNIITEQLSYYQTQVEYAYDLLRRIQLINNQNTVQYCKQCKFVDLNIQQFETQQKDQIFIRKIQKIVICMSTFLMFQRRLRAGLIKKITFLRIRIILLNHFDLMEELQWLNKVIQICDCWLIIQLIIYIDGIIAEQKVSKVALKLDQMTNQLKYINSDLDHLIYRTAEEQPKSLEQTKHLYKHLYKSSIKQIQDQILFIVQNQYYNIRMSFKEDFGFLNDVEHYLPLIDEDGYIIKFTSNLQDSVNNNIFILDIEYLYIYTNYYLHSSFFLFKYFNNDFQKEREFINNLIRYSNDPYLIVHKSVQPFNLNFESSSSTDNWWFYSELILILQTTLVHNYENINNFFNEQNQRKSFIN